MNVQPLLQRNQPTGKENYQGKLPACHSLNGDDRTPRAHRNRRLAAFASGVPLNSSDGYTMEMASWQLALLDRPTLIDTHSSELCGQKTYSVHVNYKWSHHYGGSSIERRT